jgi:hypothetical protein
MDNKNNRNNGKLAMYYDLKYNKLSEIKKSSFGDEYDLDY